MLVAGIMSGTSADAIDVALVEITGRGWNTRLRLRAFHSVSYKPAVRQKILAVAGGNAVHAAEISQLNFLLGELFARACIAACRRAGISTEALDLIGSHGQTIYHQNRATREAGVAVRSTLQIGEPVIIAERTGVTTVADFRPADIAAGGQGAPLVPYFDYLYYRHKSKGRIALNIGGIANLTAIPAHGSVDQVIAFDTGPGNMLIDALAARITGGMQRFDRGGRLAAAGRIDEVLIQRLVRQRYFRLPPPKSAGREQFGEPFLKQHFLSRFGSTHHSLRDALATATAFTAETIARAIADHVLPRCGVAECFVSGGGVRNNFLMDQLRLRLARVASRAGSSQPIRVVSTERAAVPSQAKEAVAFALLAYQTHQREPSNVVAATGASHPAILGKVIYARE